MSNEKIEVEFEDGWAVRVSLSGDWSIIDTSGSKVATLEAEDIVKVFDKLGLIVKSK